MAANPAVPESRKDAARFEAGHPVKGRNEPCFMKAVLDVVAGTKGVDPAVVAQAAYDNTIRLFFPATAQ